MRAIIFTFFFATTIILNGQTSYQPGFFVDNQGNRTEGFVFNQDWRRNPTWFYFKATDDSPSQRMEMHGVSEFGVYNFFRYVRATVDCDTSPIEFQNLSAEADPVWASGTFFLKVEVEGPASLYSLQGNSFLFFFSTADNPITQLVYQQYHVGSDAAARIVASNRSFFRQPYSYVNCNNHDVSCFHQLDYSISQLSRVFEEHNNCLGEGSIVYSNLSNKKRKVFSLLASAGFIHPSVTVNHPFSQARTADFGSQTSLSFKVEGEFLLPFHVNAWSVPFGVFNTKYEAEVTEGCHLKRISLNSTAALLGFRRYFFINPNLNLYANVFFNFYPTKPSSSYLFVSEALGQEFLVSGNFSF